MKKILDILKSFNRWRREGCSFRLIVIILIFSMDCIWPFVTQNHCGIIEELTWFCCYEFKLGTQGKTESALARYYCHCEKKNLQRILSDAVKQGVIPSESSVYGLKGKAADADLTVLFNAAKKYKLIDPHITIQQIKRGFLTRAAGEYKYDFSIAWDSVYDMVIKRKPDYSQWSTWAKAVRHFLGIILFWGFLLFGVHWCGLLLLLGITYAGCLVDKYKFIIWAVALTLFCFYERIVPDPYSWMFELPLWSWILKLLCVGLIAILIGIKLNKSYSAVKLLEKLKRKIAKQSGQ